MKTKTFSILATLLIVAQSAWADAEVNSESQLREAIQTSQTVTLGNDITLGTNDPLVIENSHIVTLDLNGHTLSISCSSANINNHVIYIRNTGQLTISDASGNNSGQITGGWAYQGGGIYVEEGGSLTINGGTITGNRADQTAGDFGFGGGVENHGTMTMTGGVITGNSAVDGGAIYNGGTLTMTGGTISGNTASEGGGNDASPYYSGAGIGGGDESQGATVHIYGGTVIATSGGSDDNTKAAAIGGTLKLPDNAMVKAGNTKEGEAYVSANQRVEACLSNKYAEIEPCTHSSSTFTIDNGLTHHTTCGYCQVGAGSQAETHVFGSDGQCLCGLVALSNAASNASILTAWNEQAVPVTLHGRTLYKDGSWNTLCLPFDVNDSNTSDELTFTLHSSLQEWYTLDGRRLTGKPAQGAYILIMVIRS